MRLLFCTLGYYPRPPGGAERQAQLQAEELARRGHEVTVVCPATGGDLAASHNGVAIIRLPRVNRRPFKTATYAAALAAYLALNMRRFDLAHVHLANFQAHVVAGMGKALKIPVYVKVAASGPMGDVARLARFAPVTHYLGLRGATRVQALSDEIVSELAAIGVPSERIARIPNGIRLDRFRNGGPEEKQAARVQLGLPAEKRIVLFSGRLAAYKGIDDLMTVWTGIKRTDAVLVVVGSSDTEDAVSIQADRPGVIFRGWTDAIDLYYRAADVFVLPSHVEGMSNSLLEAMASGLAVVATRVGAAESMITDGDNGLLIAPRDVAALGTALECLASDAVYAGRLGSRAALSVQQYSISTVVDRIESCYEGFLGTSEHRQVVAQKAA